MPALLALTLLGLASPRIAVKARAHIEGLKAQSDGRSVRVRGVLRDNLGQPLPRQAIVVAAPGVERPARTDTQGGFDVELRLTAEGEQRIEVRFDGNALVGPVDSATPVRVGRGAVTLRLQIPAVIEAEQAETVSADALDADGKPLPGIQLQLRLDGAPAQPVHVGPDGRAVIDLPPLAAGAHRLRAYFAGDADRLPADDEAGFEAARTMGVGLEIADPQPAPGQPLVFTGRVEGPDAATVRLLLAGRVVTSARANAEGRFAFTVDADAVGAGAHRFRAGAISEAAGWRDGLSKPVEVVVPAPPPPSPWWLWTPVLLALVSLLGVLGRAWIRRPRPKAQVAPPPLLTPPPFTFEAAPRGGTGDLQVTLRDGLSGAPLQGTVVLLPAGVTTPGRAEIAAPDGVMAPTDAAGQARLAGQGDRLWAWAEGYAPACHPLPASGGFAGINLLPVRARLQTLYAEVLEAAGRPPLVFGRQTPREAAPPLARRGAPGDPLAALTRLVEEACFGHGRPDHAALVEADRLATAVEAGLR